MLLRNLRLLILLWSVVAIFIRTMQMASSVQFSCTELPTFLHLFIGFYIWIIAPHWDQCWPWTVAELFREHHRKAFTWRLEHTKGVWAREANFIWRSHRGDDELSASGSPSSLFPPVSVWHLPFYIFHAAERRQYCDRNTMQTANKALCFHAQWQIWSDSRDQPNNNDSTSVETVE